VQKEVDVIIIGAGLSGLAAGWELTKHGKSFTILEARHRVGGRILTITHEGSTIDLGAQWISPHQPRIQALLKSFQIKTIPTNNKGNTVYDLHNKQRIGSSNTPPISPIGLLDLQHIQRKINQLTKDFDIGTFFQSPFARKYDALTMSSWIEDEMFSSEGKAFCRVFAEEATSLELSEFSLLNILWFIKSAGGLDHIFSAEDEWIEGGAQALSDQMAAAMKDHIHLNQPVRKIKWSQTGVTVYTDTQFWRSEKVIVAIPPTFSGKIQYEPTLPSLREQLCQRVGQGSSIKAVFVYEKPFWREKGLSGNSYFDQGPVRSTLDSTTPGQTTGVLTALIGGKHARDLGLMPTNERKQTILTCLARLFGREALEPLAYFEKDWSEDPWSRGGYAAHFAPGVLTEFGLALFKPVGPIHWAGTETSREWRLYMEGAIESGERAAKETLSGTTE